MQVIQTGIAIFENVFIKNEELIDLAESSGKWRPGLIGQKQEPDPKFRITDIHDLDPATALHKELQETIVDSVKEYAQHYKVRLQQMEHLRVARYPEGGFYAMHSDADGKRQISFVLFLNSDYSGGQLHFENQRLSIEPKSGSLVVFPSNYLFRHECMPVVRGQKYVSIGWCG